MLVQVHIEYIFLPLDWSIFHGKDMGLDGGMCLLTSLSSIPETALGMWKYLLKNIYIRTSAFMPAHI